MQKLHFVHEHLAFRAKRNCSIFAIGLTIKSIDRPFAALTHHAKFTQDRCSFV